MGKNSPIVKNEDLDRLYSSGVLSELDIHFARFIGRLSNSHVPEVGLAAAMVSGYTRHGHICLELSKLEGRQLLEGEDGQAPVCCPKLGQWREKLMESPVVGRPGEYKPMILDDNSRLYLYRYWDYEKRLADLIKMRVACNEKEIDETLLEPGLERLFGKGRPEAIDWQKVAAVMSAIKNFCVISGGPGTGKTTTVAKILALILEQAGPSKPRIALAAPTGKAAARLQEAIKRAKGDLDCAQHIKEAIPEDASTIHRLLGSIPGSPYFRYNAQLRLPVDVVIVDEASMVDLALMSKLMQAIPQHARIVLLGDRDQLASVEAGAVLGDICDTGNVHAFSKGFCERLKKLTGCEICAEQDGEGISGIRDCIVQLRKSFRFGDDSGIGAASRAVETGNDDLAVTLLKGGRDEDIKWCDLPPPTALGHALKEIIIREFADYLKAGDTREAFQMFERFRILGAVRQGPYGVVRLNALVERTLNEEGLIEADKTWYAGRPILIAGNDYNLRLFNGDIGIVLPDPETGNQLRAFFQAPDGTVRKFHPLRLPEHETVYAMTVHKSQGSEFDRILLILPDKDYPVLTGELVYTGLTRARKSVEIWGSEPVFRTAISRRIERMSGLRDALWG